MAGWASGWPAAVGLIMAERSKEDRSVRLSWGALACVITQVGLINSSESIEPTDSIQALLTTISCPLQPL